MLAYPLLDYPAAASSGQTRPDSSAPWRSRGHPAVRGAIQRDGFQCRGALCRASQAPSNGRPRLVPPGIRGTPEVKAKFTHFSILQFYEPLFSDRYRNEHFSLSISDSEHLAYREHFINIMFNERLSDSFWTPKHFGHFWTTFWVSFGLRIGHNLRNVRILHL